MAINILFRSDAAQMSRYSPARCALSFGNFDGVHLGHQALLKEMVNFSRSQNIASVVVTFSPHPATVLKKQPASFIYPLSQKIALLEKCGVDAVWVLEFDSALSQLNAKEFLFLLQKHCPFERIFLGEYACFGYRRTGTPLQVQTWEENFQITYQPLQYCQDTPISSSAIRNLIQKGALNELPLWLGRPYALSLEKTTGFQQGRKMGFPTLNFAVQDLALPPFGVYAVSLNAGEGERPAIANLGVAPTLHLGRSPLLEVHVLSDEVPSIDKRAVITFKNFIRSEKKFDSLSDLQKQIQEDIASCRQLRM